MVAVWFGICLFAWLALELRSAIKAGEETGRLKREQSARRRAEQEVRTRDYERVFSELNENIERIRMLKKKVKSMPTRGHSVSLFSKDALIARRNERKRIEAEILALSSRRLEIERRLRKMLSC